MELTARFGLHLATTYGLLALVSLLRSGWRWRLWMAAPIVALSIADSLLEIAAGVHTDWATLARAGSLAGSPDIYAILGVEAYRYSPLYAWLLVPLAWMGPWAFAALHVAAALAFGSLRVTALVLISWPFWFDAVNGNVLIFVVLAAWWAVRGNRWAALVYLALCLLMPRPVMLPVAAWLLWRQRDLWIPFAAIFVAHAAAVVATGLAPQWVVALLAAGTMIDHPLNTGPSLLVAWWVPIGLVLAAWLTWRGRLGLASLAVSPYLIPYYWLFSLLELDDAAAEKRAAPLRSGEELISAVSDPVNCHEGTGGTTGAKQDDPLIDREGMRLCCIVHPVPADSILTTPSSPS